MTIFLWETQNHDQKIIFLWETQYHYQILFSLGKRGKLKITTKITKILFSFGKLKTTPKMTSGFQMMTIVLRSIINRKFTFLLTFPIPRIVGFKAVSGWIFEDSLPQNYHNMPRNLSSNFSRMTIRSLIIYKPKCGIVVSLW